MAQIILLADFLDHGRTFSNAVVDVMNTEPMLWPLTDGGVGTLSQSLEETSDTIRLGGCSLRLVNVPGLLESFTPRPLLLSRVRLRLGFDTIPLSKYLTVYTGVVDRYTITWQTLDLALSDATVQDDVNLAVRLGTDAFPDAPDVSKGNTIPIYFGVHSNVEALPVDDDDTRTYVLGYGVQRLNRVYVNNVSIAEDRVQAFRLTVGLAQVVLLQFLFSFDIGLQVTAGVNAASPTMEILGEPPPEPPEAVDNLLVNGDFETGDFTGWQQAESGIIDITSPFEGACDAMVFPIDAAEAMYQDVTTAPGTSYDCTVQYRNTMDDLEGENLLENGGFEAGSLAGWNVQIARLNEPLFTFPTGGAAGARYLHADVPLEHLDPVALGYGFVLYQDVPTVPGHDYFFSMYSLTYDEIQLGGPGGGVPFHDISTVSYMIGTPGTEIPVGIFEDFKDYFILRMLQFSGQMPRLGAWSQLAPLRFTAAESLTRIILIGTGNRLLNTDSFVPLAIDGVLVQDATPDEPPTSQARLLVGTPDAPTVYGDVRPPVTLDWGEVLGTFVATEETTRVTLLSEVPAGAFLATHFDACTLKETLATDQPPDIVTDHQQGENPIDAILFMLRTFRPDSRYDRASFAIARARLADWKFKGTLTDPGDLGPLLQRMAQQCRVILLRGPDNQYFVSLRYSDETPALGLHPTNILTNTLRREPPPLDTVYTHFYVYYHGDTSSSTPASFEGMVWCTPSETSVTGDDGAALVALCAAANATYGVERRLEFFAEWIFDKHTAEQMLNFLVHAQTTAHPTVTCSTWLDAVPVRLGQRLAIEHALVPGGETVGAQVVSTQWDPKTMSVQLQARVQEAITDLPPVTGVAPPEEYELPYGPFTGLVYDNDRYIYMIPNGAGYEFEQVHPGFSHSHVVRYDTTLGFQNPAAYTAFDLTLLIPHISGYSRGCFDGQYVYFTQVFDATEPNISLIWRGRFVRYDTTRAFDDPDSWGVFDASLALQPLVISYLAARGMTADPDDDYAHRGLLAFHQVLADTEHGYLYYAFADASHVILDPDLGTRVNVQWLVRYTIGQDFFDPASYSLFNLYEVAPPSGEEGTFPLSIIRTVTLHEGVLYAAAYGSSPGQHVLSHPLSAPLDDPTTYTTVNLHPDILPALPHLQFVFFNHLVGHGPYLYLIPQLTITYHPPGPPYAQTFEDSPVLRYDTRVPPDDPGAYVVFDTQDFFGYEARGWDAAVIAQDRLWLASNATVSPFTFTTDTWPGGVIAYDTRLPFDDDQAWDFMPWNMHTATNITPGITDAIALGNRILFLPGVTAFSSTVTDSIRIWLQLTLP